MKKLVLFIAAVALVCFSSNGQAAKDPPASVKAAFSQKFPTATKVTWGAESEKEWEAEFKKDGKEYSANFDLTGKWTETEYEISVKEIPAAVKAAIDKEFAGYKIGESVVSETPDAKLYEVEVSKGKEKLDVAFDAAGKVISKEVAKEEEDDKEN